MLDFISSGGKADPQTHTLNCHVLLLMMSPMIGNDQAQNFSHFSVLLNERTYPEYAEIIFSSNVVVEIVFIC